MTSFSYKNISEERFKFKPLSFSPYLLLFAGSFIYFSFIADYICFYQEKLSLFVFSTDFLRNHLKQPGLPLIYFGRFLTTFFYHPVYGGIIISFLLCSIVFLISRIIRHLSGNRSLVIPIIAGLAVFYLQSDYHFLLFNTLGLLVQITAFYLIIRHLKGWIPLLIFPVLFFITGSFSFIFCVLYTTYVFNYALNKSWYKLLTLYLLAIVIVYVSKEFLFFQTFRTIVLFPLSKNDIGQDFPVFLVVSGLISLIPLYSRIPFACPLPPKVPVILKKCALMALYLAALVAIPLICFDKKSDQYFIVEKLFYEGRFNDVTGYLEKNSSVNKLSLYLNNIALCETGRLNDKLFRFRQDPGGNTLFLKWEMHSEILRNGGYFYYTTGMINEAIRWAYENMVMEGVTPEGLRLLMKAEIINGDYPVAAKYIEILKKTIFYKAEAKKYEVFLCNDEAINNDPDLGLRRRSRITHDFFTLTGDPSANIGLVLSADSLNRRAFEYQLAYMLIRKDHKGIADALSRISMYGFTGIPKHLEEAAIVYKRIYAAERPSSGTLQISQNTEARFARFMQTLKSYGNDPGTAEPYLRKDFGDTFWYYVFYR